MQGCTATGSGYGNTLTGTITLTNAGGFTCTTYPVLNVTTNAGGNITTVNSVATQGVCTSLGDQENEVWSVTTTLSAGTGAIFTPTWAGINQTYTPTANMKMIYACAVGAGGGGGGSGSLEASSTASSGGGGGGGGERLCGWFTATDVGASMSFRLASVEMAGLRPDLDDGRGER